MATNKLKVKSQRYLRVQIGLLIFDYVFNYKQNKSYCSCILPQRKAQERHVLEVADCPLSPVVAVPPVLTPPSSTEKPANP